MSVIRTLAGTWLGRAVGGVVVIALVGGVLVAPRLSSGAAKAELRTSPVTRGSILQTVAVSGAVNPSAQVRLNFKSTGRLADVMVKVGDQVAAGQAIARLDTSDMEIALRQAQANLMSAQAKYDQTLAGATPEDIAIAQNSLASAQKTFEQTQKSVQTDLATAQQALAKVKTGFQSAKTNFVSLETGIRTDIDAFTAALATLRAQLKTIDDTLATVDAMAAKRQGADVAAAHKSLATADAALVSVQSLAATPLQPAAADYGSATDTLLAAVSLFERVTGGDASASNADATNAAAAFQTAQTSYSTASGRLVAAFDPIATPLATALASVQAAATSMTSFVLATDLGALGIAVTNEQQAATSIKNRLGQATTAVTSLADPIGGSYVSAQEAVLSAQDKASQSLISQENAVRSAQLSFQKTTASARSYDITQALATLTLQQIAVDKAKLDIDNATLKAPAAATVASIANQVGETVGTGANGFVVLALTSTVALHGTIGEADVAKLRLGQVATVTVDAIGATNRLTGRVTSLDPVATIQQGVPVYGIDVTIDIPDAAVRPGMSGTANVIIASKQGVLTVPNLAIRSASGRRFVMVKRDDRAEEADVTFGIANDTATEVVSGLEEGDLVVLPAPRAATGQQGQQPGGQPGGFPAGGGGGGPTVIRR